MDDNRLDFKFRFRPAPTTPNGVLLKYLKKQENPLICNEMILCAARAFWLPEAYQDAGTKKGQELKRLAQNMILLLEGQAEHLRTVFGIERSPPSVFPPLPSFSSHPPTLRVLSQAQESPEVDEAQELEGVEKNPYWQSVSKLDTGGL